MLVFETRKQARECLEEAKSFLLIPLEEVHENYGSMEAQYNHMLSHFLTYSWNEACQEEVEWARLRECVFDFCDFLWCMTFEPFEELLERSRAFGTEEETEYSIRQYVYRLFFSSVEVHRLEGGGYCLQCRHHVRELKKFYGAEEDIVLYYDMRRRV